MPDHQFLLDMDGVIGNFFKQVCLYHNRHYDPELITQYNISELWGISNNQFWKPLNTLDFWEGIEPYPYMHDFVSGLQALAPVTICTAPSFSHECIQGKVSWLKKHLGLGLTDIVFANRKYLLASPKNWLIDDSQDKVDKFIAHGGNGIIFPQPWNNGVGDWKTVLLSLERALEGDCNA
jgi:5'(3')-deoxyribonucleotidase